MTHNPNFLVLWNLDYNNDNKRELKRRILYIVYIYISIWTYGRTVLESYE